MLLFVVASSETFTAETVNWIISSRARLRSSAIVATSEDATLRSGATRAPGSALECSRAIAVCVNLCNLCDFNNNTDGPTQTTPTVHTSGSLRHARPDTASPSGPPIEDHPQAPAGEGGAGLRMKV